MPRLISRKKSVSFQQKNIGQVSPKFTVSLSPNLWSQQTKPIVISKFIMDQFGKTTLGSPHSRNTCPQKEQSIYSNNISKILRWETPTIQHSRVITIPYTISLPPTPNHLTVISSCQCQHSELHLPTSFLLEVPVCQDASPMPKWWHCQHGGNGNSCFLACRKLRGDAVLSCCADAGVQAADADAGVSMEPQNTQTCHGWEPGIQTLGHSNEMSALTLTFSCYSV